MSFSFRRKTRAFALFVLLIVARNGFSLDTVNQSPLGQGVDDFQLPPLNLDSNEDAPLSQQQKVFIKRIRIRGATVLSPEELKAVTAPYAGRYVTMAELQQLRQKITQLYISKGYITSGALLPDQKIENGEIVLLAVEGQLTQITVTGNKHLASGYVLRGFSVTPDQPVNMEQIQEQLVMLKQDTMIAKLGAKLVPGDKLGTGALELEVEESNPFEAKLAINNARNPSIGAEQAQLSVSYHSLTGWGDTLTVQVSKTEGLKEGALHYLLPVGRHIDLFSAYQNGDSDVVEDPFNEIDVESEFYDALVGLRYLPVKELNQTVTFGLTLQKRKSKTYLFGEPISFSDGVIDGVSRVSVLRMTANWLQRTGNHAFTMSGTLSRGLDAMDATVNDFAPDGRFTSFLGQLQYGYRFSAPLNELIARCDFSITSNPLLPLEKFSIGGVETVRGYRENTLVVDQGLVASLEYRIGLLRNRPTWGNLQGAVFVDYGVADNKLPPSPQPEQISSAGFGINWNPNDNINAQLYAAKAFRSIETPSYDWQDSGIHFTINYLFR